jgi:hypothetical protein
MELWQIGDSPYAPKFNIVSQPNDWAKAIKTSTRMSDLSDRRLMQLEFWTQFKEYAIENQSTLRLRKASPQHWYDMSAGNAKSHLSLIVDFSNGQIRCEFYIPDSKPLFMALFQNRETIESKLSTYELEWMELEGKKASRIRAICDIDVDDNDKWNDSFKWLMETAHDFQKVFSEQFKKLKI